MKDDIIVRGPAKDTTRKNSKVARCTFERVGCHMTWSFADEMLDVPYTVSLELQYGTVDDDQALVLEMTPERARAIATQLLVQAEKAEKLTREKR